MDIREMAVFDIDKVIALWRGTEGIGLHDECDNHDAIEMYLYRNPGMSFVAVDSGKIIGAVLCGHDSRRGAINHLAVATEYRRRGIGTRLVDKAIDALRQKSITCCNIFVYEDNAAGQAFWEKTGWQDRRDLKSMAKKIIL